MPLSGRISTTLQVLAVVLAACFATSGLASAAETKARTARDKSVPKSTELSPCALGMECDSATADAADNKSDLKNPTQFKFGNNTLHIDTNRQKALPNGVGENEQAVINKAPSEPLLQPNYLGLRFTTPIR